jgi:hypothetical protein
MSRVPPIGTDPPNLNAGTAETGVKMASTGLPDWVMAAVLFQ